MASSVISLADSFGNRHPDAGADVELDLMRKRSQEGWCILPAAVQSGEYPLLGMTLTAGRSS